MNKKQVSKAESIKLINQGVTLMNDTSDGYVTIKSKPKGIYEMKIFVHGEDKPTTMNGNFQGLLKFMNSFDDFYIEESE